MDAEHRHELKRNDLAAWISHFPEFFRKHTNQIIGAVLIILALLLWFVLPKLRNRSRIDEFAEASSKIQTAKQSLYAAAQADGDQDLTASIDASIITLESLAETEENANLAALALIKQAELLRGQLQISSEVTSEMISENISKARTAYEQALAKANSSTLKGLAEFGLGICAEEVREFDKARQIYRQVADNPEYAGTVAVVQALQRLEMLEDTVSEVIFAPAPPEEEKPAEAPLQPAEKPAGDTLLQPGEPQPSAPFVMPEENAEIPAP